jgi:hypothetical protein
MLWGSIEFFLILIRISSGVYERGPLLPKVGMFTALLAGYLTGCEPKFCYREAPIDVFETLEFFL